MLRLVRSALAQDRKKGGDDDWEDDAAAIAAEEAPAGKDPDEAAASEDLDFGKKPKAKSKGKAAAADEDEEDTGGKKKLSKKAPRCQLGTRHASLFAELLCAPACVCTGPEEGRQAGSLRGGDGGNGEGRR